MRIAYLLTRSDALGGATIHVRDLAMRLPQDGHEVMVFIGGTGMVTEELKGKGVSFKSLKFLQRSVHPYKDLRAILEVSVELKKFRPDVISTHTSKAGIIGRIAGSLLGIPTLYTPHCWSFCDGFPNAGFYRLVEKFGSLWGPKIIMVSEWERQLALAKNVASEKKLLTLHNGMPDLGEEFRADPMARPPKIVMIGRFEEQKNHRMLLEALYELRHAEWKLELIGNGPLQGEMEILAEKLGILGRVDFVGYRSDIAERLSDAQVFALVSNWESFPRSILEAMRAGLPVLTTAAGGSGESVLHGKSGYVVSLDDRDELVSSLEKLVTNASLRQEMGQCSRKRYEQFFTFERMCRETLEVYESLLS